MADYQICKEGGRPHPRTSYCDAGINHSTSNKHKGDVMERREQHNYKPLRSPAQEFPMCAVCNQRPDALIHAEHNEHTTLVEQRDLLVAALREMADKFYPHTCRFHGPQICDRCEVLRKASRALATVEQGHEELAGGGRES